MNRPSEFGDRESSEGSYHCLFCSGSILYGAFFFPVPDRCAEPDALCSRDAERPDRPCELLSAGTVQRQSGCRHQLLIWKNHDNLHVIHDHHPAVVRIKRNPFHDDRTEHDPRDPGKTELFCTPVYLHYVYCVYRGSGPDRNHCALIRKHTAEPAVSVLPVSVQPAYYIFADPFRHCIFYIFSGIFYHVPFSSKRTF